MNDDDKKIKGNKMKIKNVNVAWITRTGLTNLNSGEGGTNYTDVKKYEDGGIEKPYVSGQAMRFYLKSAIRRNNDKTFCVMDEKGNTCMDIANCDLCDLFGFMKPDSADIRVSPVKVSPAMGQLPADGNTTDDLLLRFRPGTSHDMPTVELGLNIYKCGVSIDCMRVGAKEDGKQRGAYVPPFNHLVDDNEKLNRIKEVIDAVEFITDASKQSRLMTDFTPDIVIITFQGKYSHRLQKALRIEITEENGIKKTILNKKLLEDTLIEIKPFTVKMFIGIKEDIIDNVDEIKTVLKKFGYDGEKTPFEALDMAKEACTGEIFFENT